MAQSKGFLPLESKRWSGLDHAYGSAEDVPELIDGLACGYKEALSELWSCICHQGSIYGASHAAFPHLVAVASKTRKAKLRAEILILVGAIRSSRGDRSARKPNSTIRRACDRAAEEALKLVLNTLKSRLDRSTAVELLAAAASLKGFPVVARALAQLSSGEIFIVCEKCELDLWARFERRGLTVAAYDPAPGMKETRATLGPLPTSSRMVQYEWLLQVGGRWALPAIRKGLPFLFGSAVCPGCGYCFTILDNPVFV